MGVPVRGLEFRGRYRSKQDDGVCLNAVRRSTGYRTGKPEAC